MISCMTDTFLLLISLLAVCCTYVCVVLCVGVGVVGNDVILFEMKELRKDLKPIIRKAKTKQASKLSLEDQKAFCKARLRWDTFISMLDKKVPSQKDFDFVYGKVKEYTEQMQRNLGNANTDEDKFIQLPTYTLMQDLLRPLVGNELIFMVKKNKDSVETSYRTTLTKGAEDLVPVTGETDQLVAVGDTPVANVEVKNLLKSLLDHPDVSEFLVEVKAFAERYSKFMSKEPLRFPGVMVSGRKWQFLERIYRNGSEKYVFYPMLDTLFENENEPNININEENLKLVCRCLLRVVDIVKVLVQKIRKEILDIMLSDNDEQEEGNEDSEDDNYDEDDYEEESKKSSNKSQNKRKRDKRGSSSSNKHSRNSRSQSNLTVLNLYQHEMHTLWQQPNRCGLV